MNTVNLDFFQNQIPTVTTLHHIDSKTNLAPLFTSDAIMTVSKPWLEKVAKLGIPQEKIGLVPFGINTDAFHPVPYPEKLNIRKRLSIRPDTFLVGFASRSLSNNEGRKGIECFIHALRLLQKQHPNISSVIIGPGWHQLAHWLNKQNIPCHRRPYQFQPDSTSELYKALDVFWVTSRNEGGPIPLLEAMACGIPSISTPVGAALDLIHPYQNAFIVPFNDADKFASLSLHLLANPNLKKEIGEAARKTIIHHRQWEQTQQKARELYEIAIKNFQIRFPSQRFRSPQSCSSINLFSSSIQKKMLALENLRGLRTMLEMREWGAAGRMGFTAIRNAPFNIQIWHELFNTTLKSTQKSRKHTRHLSNQLKLALTSSPR